MPYPQRTLVEAEAEIARLRAAITQDMHDIEQTLGRALGYPRFADDQKNFPGATDADGVCVGDHVAVTLASEAARRLMGAEAEIARLRAENVELQNGIDGYARQLEARKAEVVAHAALGGRLIAALQIIRRGPALPREDRGEGKLVVSARDVVVWARELADDALGDPALAPWRTT